MSLSARLCQGPVIQIEVDDLGLGRGPKKPRRPDARNVASMDSVEVLATGQMCELLSSGMTPGPLAAYRERLEADDAVVIGDHPGQFRWREPTRVEPIQV